jgi:D-alanine--poly(phosphoribitol) ligase subunit 2
MPDRAAILASMYRALDTLNEQLPTEDAIAKSPAAKLYGAGGKLDSLGLISLMFAVEGQIEADFGEAISLSSASAEMSGADDPFQSVEQLVAFLDHHLNNRKAAA